MTRGDSNGVKVSQEEIRVCLLEKTVLICTELTGVWVLQVCQQGNKSEPPVSTRGRSSVATQATFTDAEALVG
jgi:hypothetical protein